MALGQFDTRREPIAFVESGDTLQYIDTLTHYLGELRPGVTIAELETLRQQSPGHGPHSIIGPVAVADAHKGDTLEFYFERLRPIEFGANFHNGANFRTGAVPELFPRGAIHFFDLDEGRMTTRFGDGITLPLAPFQGTIGVAQPTTEPDVVSSVPPGQHAGNIDLRHLVEGTKLFVPVWRDGALIFTGDSHAAQGDGEVNLTAIETAMREVRVTVVLHSGAGQGLPEADRWPIAETPSHWIMVATGPNLSAAFRQSLTSALGFLIRRVGLAPNDAYALCSLAVSFQITQVVDVNVGVHGMIPKSIFTQDRLRTISVC